MAGNGARKADPTLYRRTATITAAPLETLWDQPWIGEALEQVRAIIAEKVRTTSGTVGDGLRDLVSRRGKLLRPGLVLIGAGVGAKRRPRLTDRTLRLAAGIEMLHLATLVHDDVVDGSPTRRGGATMHERYGVRSAVLMGDVLFAACFQLVADGASMRNARLLSRLVSHVCDGEVDELDQSGRPVASLRAYRRRVTGKTALLIALSAFVGAAERRRDQEIQRRLLRTGHNIGMAFQIIDDILDYQSDESRMGKPVGADLLSGVYTLPAILALRSRPEIAPLLTPPITDVDRVVRAVDAAGGIDGARAAAAQYTERAFREIGRLPAGPAVESLRVTTERLLYRDR